MTVHFTAADYGAVLPEIIVFAGALILLLIDVTVTQKKTAIAMGAALLTVALAFASSVELWIVNPGPAFPVSSTNAMFTADRFSEFFGFALLAAAALTILAAPRFVQSTHFDAGEFFSLLLFALGGMLLLTSALNLIVIFLAIELLSLALYILSGFDRTRPRSQEAGFKYFLLSSFATAFLIYGMAWVYGAVGTTSLQGLGSCLAPVPSDLPSWGIALGSHTPGHCNHVLNTPFLLVGLGLMVIGFAFKLSIVPFHMWTPDVYEGAPTPVTAFMSVATKAAVFAAFLRLFVFTLGGVSDKWFGIIWALAVATMVVGNVLALVQSSMKRMLAYSGVAHAGYVLVALAATNTLGSTAVAFYFLVYAFMNIGAFILVIVLENRNEAGDDISSYRGLFSRSPALAVATAIFMFSLAGIPPTAGFFAKYYAFAAAVLAGHTDLVIIGVVTSVLSLGYYLRVVVLMFMRPVEEPSKRVSPSWTTMGVLGASVAGVLVIGLVPWFYNLAVQAVHSAMP